MNHRTAIELSGHLGSEPALYLDFRASSTRKSHGSTSSPRKPRISRWPGLQPDHLTWSCNSPDFGFWRHGTGTSTPRVALAVDCRPSSVLVSEQYGPELPRGPGSAHPTLASRRFRARTAFVRCADSRPQCLSLPVPCPCQSSSATRAPRRPTRSRRRSGKAVVPDRRSDWGALGVFTISKGGKSIGTA